MRAIAELGDDGRETRSRGLAVLIMFAVTVGLVVEETTVKTHVRHLLQKLGLRDRVQAVVFGHEALVRPGSA